MKLKREKLFTPFSVVSFSTIVSVLLFSITYAFLHDENFEIGLAKAIIIPIAIALPISLYSKKYHQKIKTQKEELERLNNTNKKLMSIIAHDIRSPLGIVKGYSEMIYEDANNKDTFEIHNKLDKVATRIDNLLLFLNDLLRWSKNQIHTCEVQLTPFSTKETIDTIIDRYASIGKQKEITTTTSIEVEELLSDKEIYSFILRNLYENALKFTNIGGAIHIQIKEIDNQIYTSIQDDGIGIQPENIEKIYDENLWFSTEGTHKEKGTGLGIKTILQYLKICNGAFKIDSAPNKGTTVTVIFKKKEIA
ncbi:sensor histidine kinase [Flavicella marina]|uniref:sensor histidine kinase n=1 Tax=Flavicella marina TaxID=1475951 RepID=UPI00126588AB|nr:HAMP domain-containing sensor histidine kinase [Flavicella marina]